MIWAFLRPLVWCEHRYYGYGSDYGGGFRYGDGYGDGNGDGNG